MKQLRKLIYSAVEIGRANGYTIIVSEKPGFIGVRVVSSSGRSDYEYDFFADSDSSVQRETLKDLINWINVIEA